MATLAWPCPAASTCSRKREQAPSFQRGGSTGRLASLGPRLALVRQTLGATIMAGLAVINPAHTTPREGIKREKRRSRQPATFWHLNHLERRVMLYTLPALPYAFDALEPHIDARTMEIHHDKHHAGYVTNLNKALEGHDVGHPTVEELVAIDRHLARGIRTAVRNHGGGHANHSLFWTILSGRGRRAAARRLGQGDRQGFRQLRSVCRGVHQASALGRFGSGWAWLCVNPRGHLLIESTANQDSPLMHGHDADPGHRRLGARLLPEVSEPPGRLRQGVLQRRRLGRRDGAIPRRLAENGAGARVASTVPRGLQRV